MDERKQELEKIMNSMIDHLRTYPKGQDGFVAGMEVSISVAASMLFNVDEYHMGKARLIAWESFSQMMASNSGVEVEKK